jgi:hypothetical protein
MTRRRYVQDPETLQLIEVTEDYYRPSNKGDAALWNDRHYEGLGTTDGVDISSRTKHREYMKRHGLVTFDDYQQSFKREQQRRDDYFQGQRGTVSRSDIERSIEQLKRG